MSKQIAKDDREAMNELFTSEYGKRAAAAGLKVAASTSDISDDNGKEQGPQAFADHAEYVDVVTNVLNDDKSESFDPNSPEKD